MKKLCIVIAICFFFSLYSSETPRRLTMFFDWNTETLSKDLGKNKFDPNNTGWGPVSNYLVTALAQKAAPIIVTSSLWHNFVARRKLFKDFLDDRRSSYRNKYPRFSGINAIVKMDEFTTYIQAYFKPSSQPPLPAGGPIREEFDAYFLCYAVPFEENEWILKKVSDYIYVLIPKVYLEQLKELQKKELEKLSEESKIFLAKAAAERNFVTPLTDEDLLLGLKISKMETISYQDALDPDKHKLLIDKNNYAHLLNPKDVQAFILWGQSITPPEIAILSKHFINMLKNIFVTNWDLVDKNKNTEKTELNRALYLHKWHIYQIGHGLPSLFATLSETEAYQQIIDPLSGTSVIPTQAGMEFHSFREWLSFLQASVQAEFLYYETCYSGGPHLQKLFEHAWDYPLQGIQKVELKPDVFRYTIITGNILYTPIGAKGVPIAFPPRQKTLRAIHVEYPIDFPSFFEASEKYFSLKHIAIAQKKTYFDALKKLREQEAKMKSYPLPPDYIEISKSIDNLKDILGKLDFITLYLVINYLHYSDEYRAGVRYPGAELFVLLMKKNNLQLVFAMKPMQKQKQEKKKKNASKR